uniref:Integrase zinc-binding domain-containing protein n=1 Tax=Amphimedon queenslandica TaxID=400682 RepID=A0A1X7UB29_AMPQE
MDLGWTTTELEQCISHRVEDGCDRPIGYTFRAVTLNRATEDNLKQYKNRKDNLSVEKGCLPWGARVIVPPQLQKLVLEEIHQRHPGIVRMKALALCYIWWPTLNADIEK